MSSKMPIKRMSEFLSLSVYDLWEILAYRMMFGNACLHKKEYLESANIEINADKSTLRVKVHFLLPRTIG